MLNSTFRFSLFLDLTETIRLFLVLSLLAGCEQDVKCLLIHFFFLPPRFWLKLIWSVETDLTEQTAFHRSEVTLCCAFWMTLKLIFEQLSIVKVWTGEGEMEGKCRPRTVQQWLQSEVEGCDWWKEKHLFISFIHLNSCKSRVLVAQPVCRSRAGSTE